MAKKKKIWREEEKGKGRRKRNDLKDGAMTTENERRCWEGYGEQ